jgi:hypothetical protein
VEQLRLYVLLGSDTSTTQYTCRAVLAVLVNRLGTIVMFCKKKFDSRDWTAWMVTFKVMLASLVGMKAAHFPLIHLSSTMLTLEIRIFGRHRDVWIALDFSRKMCCPLNAQVSSRCRGIERWKTKTICQPRLLYSKRVQVRCYVVERLEERHGVSAAFRKEEVHNTC